MRRFTLLIVLLLGSMALAEESATTTPAVTEAGGVAHTEAAESEPHPALSVDATWAGVVVILIGVMFLSAVVIGPIVRAFTPDAPQIEDHGHDAHDSHDAHAHDSHH